MRFTAVFMFEDNGWCVTIPEVQGCHSEGDTFAEAARNIREALSTCVDALGENAEEIAEEAELIPHVSLAAPASDVLALAIEDRQRAESAAAKAMASTTQALRELTEVHGLSLRDTVRLLGIRYDEAQKLLAPTSKRTPKRRRTA